MLGRRSPQRELFRPDHTQREHAGEDSFYGLLATRGAQWFRDEDRYFGKRKVAFQVALIAVVANLSLPMGGAHGLVVATIAVVLLSGITAALRRSWLPRAIRPTHPRPKPMLALACAKIGPSRPDLLAPSW